MRKYGVVNGKHIGIILADFVYEIDVYACESHDKALQKCSANKRPYSLIYGKITRYEKMIPKQVGNLTFIPVVPQEV